ASFCLTSSTLWWATTRLTLAITVLVSRLTAPYPNCSLERKFVSACGWEFVTRVLLILLQATSIVAVKTPKTSQ
ncbi:hypothetical protein, partial [Gloeocapsopsis crepidinum]|uniref:hypothetical protein n=1 Tax=Gloeocapsopsis crepidinum TaxID=693223 RepID=UPI001D14BFDE